MKKTREKTYSVVIADQDPDDQYLIQKAIKNNGEHELCPVFNGFQLMELLVERLLTGKNSKTNLPDLIVMNLNLPMMDGFEALTRIRSHEELKNIPIFVLSSYHYEQEIKRSKELGATDFYTKPFQFHKLSEIVDEIFSRVQKTASSRVQKVAS